MSRSIWLLLLVVPLLVGCGAGLKEEGRLPVSNPLGRSDGEAIELLIGVLPASRNGGAVTRQAHASYTGSFSNTAPT